MTDDPVRIREVGPRDGFQNEPEVIPTDAKVRLVEQLARTGLRRLEVTSFVRADVLPQLGAVLAKHPGKKDFYIQVSTEDGKKVSMRVGGERGVRGGGRGRRTPWSTPTGRSRGRSAGAT